MSKLFQVALLVGLLAEGADGQSAPSFEVASVKPHKGGGTATPSCLNGRLISHGRTIYTMITKAYDLRFPQTAEMDGQLPGWANSNSPESVYDIEAKSENPVSEAQCWLMFRSLLEERFKVAMHWETKEGSVYDLVIVPSGHKMQKVTEGDTDVGLHVTINGNLKVSPGAPVIRGITMMYLASYISLSTPDRLGVVDKTGLEGLYKVDLAYSTNALEYSEPDLNTALQKQLGLKLERRKGLVKHFVLDHIERPHPNP
jgi:uncharacterized protein (TIGR03435 family)